MSNKQKSGKSRARASAKKNRIKRQQRKHMNNVLISAIRKWDDSILSEICSPVEKYDDLSFIKIMRRTLDATRDGVGISAPQIGETKCVILWKSTLDSAYTNVMLNPIVENVGDGNTVTIEEGCLSYPGFSAKIERALKIKVRWKDENWKDHVREFEGRRAIVIQHEVDHLSGECAVGKAWKESLKEDLVEDAVDEQEVVSETS